MLSGAGKNENIFRGRGSTGDAALARSAPGSPSRAPEGVSEPEQRAVLPRLSLLVGSWLVVGPALFGYGSTLSVANDAIMGALVAAVALLRLSDVVRSDRVTLLAGLPGLWLVAAAAWFDAGASIIVNNVLCGVLISALAVSERVADRRASRR